MRTHALMAALGALALGACAPAAPAITQTPAFATAALPPSPASTATKAAATHAPTAVAVPIPGSTTTQLNVRLDPLNSSTPLGVIPASTTIQILFKDPGGNWYQIQYDQGELAAAWVFAEYVSTADKSLVPVVGVEQPMASVREQINVRRGAGTEFESIGLLSPRDAVRLIGRDSGGTWVQIIIPGSPDGSGWVAATFLEAAAMDSLPIIADSGQILGTTTPTGTPPIPTPTVAAAPDDGDSAASPAADVTFAPSGTGSLIYSSDLSAPEGDADDWIRFTPHRDSVRLELRCGGNSAAIVSWQREGAGMAVESGPACGEHAQLRLEAVGVPYVVRVSVVPVDGRLVHVRYDLSIDNAR